MEDGNLAILVDAKTEYTKQLVNIMSPNIFIGIKNIYNLCKTKSSDTLYQFQQDLSEIPKWNQEVINEHCDKLIETSNCDWLEDLLTAVFVSHTRILTSINFNKNKNKINLKIPKVDHFIHLCYIEVARNFWKNPYLFDDTISKFEYQRNRRDAEKIIETTINETIRKQLPVKHILKEYLGTEFKEGNDNLINDTEHENLRKMVKAEIENCSREKLDKLNILGEDLKSAEPEKTSELLESSEPLTEVAASEEHLTEVAAASETLTEPLTEPLTEVAAALASEPLTEPLTEVAAAASEPTFISKSNDSNSDLEPISLDKKLSEDEAEIEKLIDSEVDSLKIETLNLNIDDDLSNLEEIYIDAPNKSIDLNSNTVDLNSNTVDLNSNTVDLNSNTIDLNTDNDNFNTDEKIKTVFIDTNEKPKYKKNNYNDKDFEVNYSESDDDRKSNRRKDYSFFE